MQAKRQRQQQRKIKLKRKHKQTHDLLSWINYNYFDDKKIPFI